MTVWIRVDCTVEGWTLDPLFWNNQIPCFIKYYSFHGFAYSLHLKQPPSLSLLYFPSKFYNSGKNLNTQFCSCTGWLFFVPAAALVQPQHGLVLQVSYDDEIQCTPLGIVKLWNAKHFFAVTVIWKSHWGFSNVCYIRDNLALMSL